MKIELSEPKLHRLLPAYSLTGDLLSFLRCGLQYRFHSGSKLPPSRPVQFWFGDFIHGVMERAFLLWKKNNHEFPWPYSKTVDGLPDIESDSLAINDITRVGHIVETYLRTLGKSARSIVVRQFGYERANTAINQLGPILFPLISKAEEAVIGTRMLNTGNGNNKKYELHGVVDVLTEIELKAGKSDNAIVRFVSEKLEIDRGVFEVIVDYKGARRPSLKEEYWEQHKRQIS